MSTQYQHQGPSKGPFSAVTLAVACLVFLVCVVFLKRNYHSEENAGGKSLQDNLSKFANLEAPKESILFRAERGDPEAQRILGHKYRLGEGMRKNNNDATRWFKKSADQGDRVAQFELGEMFLSGEGVERSTTTGLNLIRRSAEQDFTMAQAALGIVHLRRTMAQAAQGFRQDTEQALKWLKRAATSGDEFSLYQLGLMYAEGFGVKRNRFEAAKWYIQAANLGNPDAQFGMGLIYDEGEGVPKDTNEAASWYLKAANQGHHEAQYRVGRMYAEGLGLKKSLVEAHLWLNLSGAHGNLAAKELLPKIESQMSFGEQAEAMKRARQIFSDQQSKALPSNIAYQNSRQRMEDLARAAMEQTPLAPDVPEKSHPSPFGVLIGNGSGVIISESGLVLTAAHVIAEANKLQVVTSQGTVGASILRVDDVNDLAVLKLDGGKYQFLAIAPSRSVRLGQEVATIGFPNITIQGFSPKITKGSVSSENGIGDDPRSWQISVPVQPGNSGGPLLDEYGNIVGIVVSKLGLKATRITGDIPQNVNYAVKSSYALPLLEPFLSEAIAVARETADKPKFEDMVLNAQRSVVLILVY